MTDMYIRMMTMKDGLTVVVACLISITRILWTFSKIQYVRNTCIISPLDHVLTIPNVSFWATKFVSLYYISLHHDIYLRSFNDNKQFPNLKPQNKNKLLHCNKKGRFYFNFGKCFIYSFTKIWKKWNAKSILAAIWTQNNLAPS